MTRRLLPYGAGAVLLECADLAETQRLRPAIEQRFDQISEIIPGARTLLLRLSRPLSAGERQDLLDLPGADELSTNEQATVTIDVDYSGPDLADVAGHTGMSPEEIVAAHTGQVWTVAFCGFAPGFGYLVGEHDRLRVPRRDRPRTTVPMGAVGLADTFSGIYPRSGPGGWQLIGRTAATVWDLDRDPPALLRPGHQVRFAASTGTRERSDHQPLRRPG
jgi:KipI family sensor histidine kinase inhibitor